MTDIKEWIKEGIETLEPPEMWAQIEGRVPGAAPSRPPSPLRRSLTAAVALLVFAAAALLVWAAFASSRSSPTSSAGWSSYRDPAGWTMRYPTSWDLSTFRGVCMADFNGAMVSNVPDAYHSTESATGCYWPPNMASLPPDGVVVEFDLMQGGPATGMAVTTPDTSFPLSLAALQPAPTPGSTVRWYTQPVQVNGNPRYRLDVWIGPAATEQARETASTIVASISFAAEGDSEVSVPNVMGESSDAAVTALVRAGFKVRRIAVVTGTYPKGVVVAQVPAPGTVMNHGSEVELHISTAASPSGPRSSAPTPSPL